ncbi:MAG: hypothetical protein HKK66_12445 [Chlorobiaceae bacterium]|nr:hypothetical protein [Chlorobiaceae bacterium]
MKRLLLITLALLFSPASITAKTTEQHASFDHSRLSTSAQCIRCHERDQPDDKLHSQSKGNCSICHTTKEWKPTITEP